MSRVILRGVVSLTKGYKPACSDANEGPRLMLRLQTPVFTRGTLVV